MINLTKMNKKGTILEIFVIIVVLFIIAVSLPIMKTIFDGVDESMQGKFGTTGDSIMDKGGAVFDVLDGLFLFLFLGLGIGGIILAYNMNFPPFFWIFAVIIAAVGVIIAATMSDVYGEIAASDGLSEAAGAFPGANFVMNNMVLFIVGIAFLIIIAMFIKFRGGGE